MVRVVWLCALLLAGCDQLFSDDFVVLDGGGDDGGLETDMGPGIDRDDDSIPDDADPCIAPRGELEIDHDGDSVRSDVDACPFMYSDGTANDGDMIGDNCDPFAQSRGSRRCAMALSSASINDALWMPLPGGEQWTRGPEELGIVGSTALASIRATADVLAAELPGAVTAAVYVRPIATPIAGRLILWVNLDEGNANVGCVVYRDDQYFRVAITGREATSMPVAGAVLSFALRATFVRRVESTLLQCDLIALNTTQLATVQGSIMKPNGVVGFGVQEWTVAVDSFEVLEHD